MQQNLIRPPRPLRVAEFRVSELLFNDGPEARADCTQRASTASSYSAVRVACSVSGVRGAPDRLKPVPTTLWPMHPAPAKEDAAECHRVHDLGHAVLCDVFFATRL